MFFSKCVARLGTAQWRVRLWNPLTSTKINDKWTTLPLHTQNITRFYLWKPVVKHLRSTFLSRLGTSANGSLKAREIKRTLRPKANIFLKDFCIWKLRNQGYLVVEVGYCLAGLKWNKGSCLSVGFIRAWPLPPRRGGMAEIVEQGENRTLGEVAESFNPYI